jgi:hypothetical protein
MALSHESNQFGECFASVLIREKVKPHPSLPLYFLVLEHHIPFVQLAQALLHRL